MGISKIFVVFLPEKNIQLSYAFDLCIMIAEYHCIISHIFKEIAHNRIVSYRARCQKGVHFILLRD